eukprot:CAMPEP_0174381324 /NCGR_PEP_ID=MMETSP0811_2-20130205/123936_1 /TAXON_ID=73025 ORGANISM="Eutreptiella gymnastica-like, Strain CCMP1594" /NCGR_SAMPLE_ID=MMETSP0811_2 /ASSEMBLY_ACC=CAM_ASM_000667 /LENGTH=106 /DNA_ID=CAMNT_0015534429 /DNA_START=3086 /DNA_END=3403 /DNA_ORIENTATION=+
MPPAIGKPRLKSVTGFSRVSLCHQSAPKSLLVRKLTEHSGGPKIQQALWKAWATKKTTTALPREHGGSTGRKPKRGVRGTGLNSVRQGTATPETKPWTRLATSARQ